MAFRFEKNRITGNPEIVIDGFEKGIADSAYEGIADMRNVNIITAPKEVAVNFATTALTIPPTVSAVAFTVDASNDTFTVASTTNFYNGMAIVFDTIVTATGFSTGRVYWIGNLTSTTFKIYKNPNLAVASLVDVTLSGSGTYSSYTLGAPLDRTIAYNTGTVGANSVVQAQFILDSNGRVWWVYNPAGVLTNYLVYLGNDTLTASSGGRGINTLGKYLIVFRSSTTDYLNLQNLTLSTDLDGASGWVYGWESVGSTTGQTRRATCQGQDNALYFANFQKLGSILVNAGSTFDPATSSTYTKNLTALALPNGDDVTALGELGQNLLIGGIKNYIYPWDRVSTAANYPLLLSENVTTRIVTANQNAYIFAGNRGRIYITNGANLELYKKIPDNITSTVDPYFTWQDAIYWKNQLYFSFTASTNGNVSIDTVAGVWGIDLTTNSFRYANQLSYGAYTGTTSVLMPSVMPDVFTSIPAGGGFYIGWTNSGTYGVDVTSSTPYTNYQTRIDSDLIPIGTFLNPDTISNIEWKTSKPLVSGESIKLSWRGNLTDSFTLIGTSSTAGKVSDLYTANFQQQQWLQIRYEASSTATAPSYVPLREIRFR